MNIWNESPIPILLLMHTSLNCFPPECGFCKAGAKFNGVTRRMTWLAWVVFQIAIIIFSSIRMERSAASMTVHILNPYTPGTPKPHNMHPISYAVGTYAHRQHGLSIPKTPIRTQKQKQDYKISTSPISHAFFTASHLPTQTSPILITTSPSRS